MLASVTECKSVKIPIISVRAQTERLVLTQFMQGTPNPEHTHQWKAEGSSELSEGVVIGSPAQIFLT